MKNITFDKTLFQVVIYFSQYKSSFIGYATYIHVCKWGTVCVNKKSSGTIQRPIMESLKGRDGGGGGGVML